MGYNLQGNQITLEGSEHAGRNAQFEFIDKECGLDGISAGRRETEKVACENRSFGGCPQSHMWVSDKV